MKKFFRVFYSQIFNSFFPVLIIGILIKLKNSNDIASIFLLINFSNIYLLFSDYSSNTIFLKAALSEGGISSTRVSSNIINDIHSYIGIKILILIIGFIVWIPIVFYTPILQRHALSNILAYTFIVGININFYWLYMCSSKEYFFIISNFISRIFFLCLLLAFIFFNFNMSFLMPLVGLATIVISIVTFIRFCAVYKIRVVVSGGIVKNAVTIIRRDWPFVANSFLIMTPTTCLSFFVGFIKDSQHVIIYAFAEKIFMAIRALLAVFVNSIFPVICAEGSVTSKKSNRLFLFFYLLIVVGCAFTYFISPIVFDYFKQPKELNYIFYKCLFYFMLTIIIISINTRYFLNLLVHNHFNDSRNSPYFLASAIIILLVFSINAFFINSVFSIIQSLLVAEILIVLNLVFLNYRTRPGFAT
jgi:hypothetical protein